MRNGRLDEWELYDSDAGNGHWSVLLLSQWGLLLGRGEVDYFFFEFGRERVLSMLIYIKYIIMY